VGQGSRGRLAISIEGAVSHTLLILPAKSKQVLDLIHNRFAAELNHWFGPSQATAFSSNFAGAPTSFQMQANEIKALQNSS
jgi:hypothetical protein